MINSEMQKIPQVEQLIGDQRLSAWIEKISRPLTTAAVRRAVEYSRDEIKNGKTFDEDKLFHNIDKLCSNLYSHRIQPVINATGVILHTNMGRSPIPSRSWEDCRDINTGYSNLELSLKTGKRGKRSGLVPKFINALTGAQACAVVNNNAAAVYLVLCTFAAGKEVIVSRGEQVQIGGGFRIPEILALSGAKLVEVGTTNITTVNDYLNAVTENTAMILKVHRSNFALRGFTSDPSLKELTKALPENVLTVVDQGSGVLNENLPGEARAASILADGADIITFSGDKIIGGPQAGIIAGNKELVAQIDHHPLIRTMRPGKTIYSLLESVLLSRMENPGCISRHAESVKDSDDAVEKCRRFKRGLPADKFKLIDDTICIGGGSTPDKFFDSKSVEIVSEKMKPQLIIKKLREYAPPIIATIKNDRAIINPFVFTEDDMKYVKSVLKELEEQL